MPRPNLFDFATSELSQDAFICWLLSWADPPCRDQDEKLHESGTELVTALFDAANIEPPASISTIEVKKQYKNIDVLAVINGSTPLLIEDKTHTKDHSGQLARYRDQVKQEFGPSKFPAIYFKTGDQSSYESIKEAGYGIFNRKDLLDVLKKGVEAGVTNRIFLDFYEYLSVFDASVAEFKTIPVADWHWNCWTGFFIELQKQLEDGAWDYVANPSGGFMGFWWHWKDNKYLQLEEGKLCFKLEVEEKDQQSDQRNYWHDQLTTAAATTSLSITKPSRFGKGTWMTAAILADDYRKCGADGLLDLDATVDGLRKAESFMDGLL